MALFRTRKIVALDGQIFRGIKVTKNNVEKVAAWVERLTKNWKRSHPLVSFAEAILDTKRKKDGSIDIRNRVRVYTRKGWRVARIGDIVAYDKDTDKFFIIKPEEFKFYDRITYGA